ncbi:low molecular weight protein-tyrosine-phosphatase [Halothiobacillus sp.]|uniref:low molecular weight protein-tyrosine-phosphatase n=1 Tax=Halothiobacillus sp. TaxID=1891311 RepID=UPI002AD4A196|nr:low molecular weight protein-tyrosine-phosphatase [Halothiobacillus sp.]
MPTTTKATVLFVCMGNICRSPTAEAVFRKLVIDEGLEAHIQIDSAGTHAYHIGNPPDARSTATALRRGYQMDVLRARQVTQADIQAFDYVLAMDRDNAAILRQLAPAELQEKPRLLMSYAADYGIDEVPDPYYGGGQGFEQVLDMIEEASASLLAEIRRNLPRPQKE